MRMLPSFQAGISGGGGGSGRYSSAASKTRLLRCCSSAIPSVCPDVPPTRRFYRKRGARANARTPPLLLPRGGPEFSASLIACAALRFRRFSRLLRRAGRSLRSHHGFRLPKVRVGLDPIVRRIAHLGAELRQSRAGGCDRRIDQFGPPLLPIRPERFLEVLSYAHRCVQLGKGLPRREDVDRSLRSAVTRLEKDVVLVQVDLVGSALVQRDELLPVLAV